jgi:hypothetical protein
MKIPRTSHQGGHCQVSGDAPPHSPQPDPALWNNPLTRRRFLRTSGAATAGLTLAGVGTLKVLATPSGGGSWWVLANPNTSYTETTTQTSGALSFKGKTLVLPAGGEPSAVTFTFKCEVWTTENYAGTNFPSSVSVTVSVDASGNLSVGGFSSPQSDSQSQDFDYSPLPIPTKKIVQSITTVSVLGTGTPDVSITVEWEIYTQEMYCSYYTQSWNPTGSPANPSILGGAEAESQYDPTP